MPKAHLNPPSLGSKAIHDNNHPELGIRSSIRVWMILPSHELKHNSDKQDDGARTCLADQLVQQDDEKRIRCIEDIQQGQAPT